MENALEIAQQSDVIVDESSKHAITCLQLFAFRNYSFAEIQSGTSSIILTGHNGAGKTNILEAISLLAPGRGLRKAALGSLTNQSPNVSLPSCGGRLGGGQADDASTLTLSHEWVREKSKDWVVSVEATGRHGAVQIGTGKDTESMSNRRIIKIDGEKVNGQHKLTQHLSVLWQTPQMDGLFIDSGSVRRRFLDRLVYNVDAEHAARVSAYEHAMRERTKLLQSHGYDAQWVGVLEQRMAQQSVAIAAARNEVIDRLNAAIVQSNTGFPKAHLSLVGEAEQALLEEKMAVDLEEEIVQTLHDRRSIDGAAGRATCGVHRTELKVMHLLKNMEAALCSTGEQKAMLLSMLLAHARARKEWQGAAPILLLDEVVAHLDMNRRQELFDEIECLGAQAWLTGTDAADFSAFTDHAKRFVVESAKITEA